MIRIALPLLCLPLPAIADISVVTDIAPIHSLTAQIMGDTGTPHLILPANADAHDFAFRVSDGQALQDADLVIMVGPALTPWLAEPVETFAASAAHLVLMETEGWTALDMRSEHHHGHEEHAEEAAHDDHGHDEHADHDDHKSKASDKDPHAWMDPTIAAVWAGAITKALVAADPENAATYEANLVTTQASLAALDAKYATQLADAGTLLWPHDGYQYLEARYGLDAIGSIADVNAATPGPGRIQALIDLIAAENITCIMTDREINGDWADLVREGSDAGTTFIDGIGGGQDIGPGLYQGMMDTLVTAITDC